MTTTMLNRRPSSTRISQKAGNLTSTTWTLLLLVLVVCALVPSVLLYPQNAASLADISWILSDTAAQTNSISNNNNNPVSSTDCTSHHSSKTSDLAWKFYDSYRYVKPSSYEYIPSRQDNKRGGPCGQAPDFDYYFSLPVDQRSRMNEDKYIYQWLFHPNHTTTTANSNRNTQETPPQQQGTVVELGGYDGVTESNSRFFEKCLGWKSLLVEGNPENYNTLLSNRPFAHKMSFAPSCSAEYERVNQTVKFARYPMTNAGIDGYALQYKDRPMVDVPCGPLAPVLDYIFGQQQDEAIYFFSLDVEGAEMRVLETIDFQNGPRIYVMLIEVVNTFCPAKKPCPVRDQVREKMAQEGYRQYANLIHASDLYIHPESPFQISKSLLQNIRDKKIAARRNGN